MQSRLGDVAGISGTSSDTKDSSLHTAFGCRGQSITLSRLSMGKQGRQQQREGQKTNQAASAGLRRLGYR